MNIYVLWKMSESHKIKLLQDSLSSIKEEVKQSPAESRDREETQYLLVDQSIDEIRAIIEKLEARIEYIEEISSSQEAQDTAISVQDSFSDIVTTSLKSQVESDRDSEDWFWNSTSDGGHEKSLSFSQNDGFNTNSIVCRAEWCRVEIEDEIAVDEGVDPEHELQLRIDESLGRDTTIRWGKKEGNRRVVFIQ